VKGDVDAAAVLPGVCRCAIGRKDGSKRSASLLDDPRVDRGAGDPGVRDASPPRRDAAVAEIEAEHVGLLVPRQAEEVIVVRAIAVDVGRRSGGDGRSSTSEARGFGRGQTQTGSAFSRFNTNMRSQRYHPFRSLAIYTRTRSAGVMKLVNIPALGAGARKSLGVRVPPPALAQEPRRCRGQGLLATIQTPLGQWPNWLRHRSPKPAIPGSSPGCPVFRSLGKRRNSSF
jgi:hypothetical protein